MFLLSTETVIVLNGSRRIESLPTRRSRGNEKQDERIEKDTKCKAIPEIEEKNLDGDHHAASL